MNGQGINTNSFFISFQLQIACISPARYNLIESLNTLRYAARAKRIRTKPIVVMDPREALILSLKREVGALQQENDHLRATLRMQNGSGVAGVALGDLAERKTIAEAPKVDLDRVTELDGSELTELLKSYLNENQALRQENNELYSTRDMIVRDQEIVCRENERLLKKLEDVNSVCCRSPIIPARPTFSGDMLNVSSGSDQDANIWTNPMSESPIQSTTNGRLSISLGRPISQTTSENNVDDEEVETDALTMGNGHVATGQLRRNKSWDQNGNNEEGVVCAK